MATFEEQIKRWVTLDNQVRVLASQAKTLRQEKETTEENLLAYVETNQLTNATVNITDGRLRFVTTKQTAALTLGHVEACLRKSLPETQVKQLMQTIKAERVVKEVADIKRYGPAKS